MEPEISEPKLSEPALSEPELSGPELLWPELSEPDLSEPEFKYTKASALADAREAPWLMHVRQDDTLADAPWLSERTWADARGRSSRYNDSRLDSKSEQLVRSPVPECWLTAVRRLLGAVRYTMPKITELQSNLGLDLLCMAI